MTTRRTVLKGAAASVAAAVIPVAPVAFAVEAAKPAQPMMDYAQLAEWALKNGYGERELFFADGIEDACEACDYGDPNADSVRPAGTPMVCYRSSYEYEEYDTRCVQCQFDDIWFWQNLTEAEVQEMFADQLSK